MADLDTKVNTDSSESNPVDDPNQSTVTQLDDNDTKVNTDSSKSNEVDNLNQSNITQLDDDENEKTNSDSNVKNDNLSDTNRENTQNYEELENLIKKFITVKAEKGLKVTLIDIKIYLSRKYKLYVQHSTHILPIIKKLRHEKILFKEKDNYTLLNNKNLKIESENLSSDTDNLDVDNVDKNELANNMISDTIDKSQTQEPSQNNNDSLIDENKDWPHESN